MEQDLANDKDGHAVSSIPRHLLTIALSVCSLITFPACVALAFPEGDRQEEPAAQKLPDDHLENLYRVSEKLYSGATPESPAAFEKLRALGIRTIVSVDGAAPDAASAKRVGIRYVHLPIGYDGIPAEKALRIIKAAQDLPGPVYVHCHHGIHRGPAAAALCAVAIDGWSREQAIDWMREAGTSKDYCGLFKTLETLPLPTPDDLRSAPADFPEKAPVSTIVETMIQIDLESDRLKAHAKDKFAGKVAPDEVGPNQAALQLAEQLRELVRSEAAEARGPEFVAEARSAATNAEALVGKLKLATDSRAAKEHEAALEAYRRIARDCKSCHARFRD